ncbi:hypothetical protein L1987_15228 [Smallanthus sonchifolius]|uniref:Uncharacterized protein n=1 Tax=Smallanthus sonchifolius TaxID=185202 RepID=A0ACB9J5C8_9ASTR|nr:hypothetical protein L1987_15228 [Smallanthus sonchifolius]
MTQVANLKENEKRQDQDITRLKSTVTNQQQVIDKMLKMIIELENRANFKTKAISLLDCFDFDAFENEAMSAGTLGANTAECISKRRRKEEDEEDKGKKKDSDDKEDDDKGQGNMGSGSSDSTDSNGGDGDNKGVATQQQSTDQVTKPTYTTTDGQVFYDLDSEDNIGGSVGASSPGTRIR